MQKSQFIRLKPASSQISNCLLWNLILSTYQTKNISLKITIEKILRILLRIYKIKKTKEIFPLSFYFLQRKTHPLESMAKCTSSGKKLVFLAVVGFCYQCFENPFGYLLIRFFGVLKIFPIQLAKLDSQGSYSGLKYCPICTESCCIFAICGSVRGFIVSEVFWGAWIVSMAISACLGFFCLNLNENPVIVRPFLCCS